MVKDIELTNVWQIRILPRILKFRFSLNMVKDDWPPGYDRQGSYLEF